MEDILLEKNAELNTYDFSIENGDFKKTDGLDSVIITSLLIDKRAESSDVTEPEFRRGWLGNELNNNPNYQIGSLLWLTYQARTIQKTLNDAITYAKDCLAWMIEDSLVKDIIVTGTLEVLGVSLFITFVRFDNSVFNKQYDLWENTNIA